jgi:hypothetical protein
VTSSIAQGCTKQPTETERITSDPLPGVRLNPPPYACTHTPPLIVTDVHDTTNQPTNQPTMMSSSNTGPHQGRPTGHRGPRLANRRPSPPVKSHTVPAQHPDEVWSKTVEARLKVSHKVSHTSIMTHCTSLCLDCTWTLFRVRLLPPPICTAIGVSTLTPQLSRATPRTTTYSRPVGLSQDRGLIASRVHSERLMLCRRRHQVRLRRRYSRCGL